MASNPAKGKTMLLWHRKEFGTLRQDLPDRCKHCIQQHITLNLKNTRVTGLSTSLARDEKPTLCKHDFHDDFDVDKDGTVLHKKLKAAMTQKGAFLYICATCFKDPTKRLENCVFSLHNNQSSNGTHHLATVHKKEYQANADRLLQTQSCRTLSALVDRAASLPPCLIS